MRFFPQPRRNSLQSLDLATRDTWRSQGSHRLNATPRSSSLVRCLEARGRSSGRSRATGPTWAFPRKLSRRTWTLHCTAYLTQSRTRRTSISSPATLSSNVSRGELPRRSKRLSTNSRTSSKGTGAFPSARQWQTSRGVASAGRARRSARPAARGGRRGRGAGFRLGEHRCGCRHSPEMLAALP